MTDFDPSRFKKVEMTPEQKRQSLQKKPKKKLKKDRSKLQVKKDRPNSKYWKTKADKAWGELLHKKFDRCLVCHTTTHQLQAHHLISRAKVNTRHDPKNGVILCNLHHNTDPECSPHAGPLGFSEFLRKRHPEKFDYVFENMHQTTKPDYREAYEHLTGLLNEMSTL